MITTPGHSLIFGNVDLLGKDHTAGWWIEATGEGASFGNAESVIRTVLSFLMDGAIEHTDSHGNREMTFRVRLTGTSSANLALAEQALHMETEKRNVLTWTPPDNTGDFAGTPSVFQVANSSLSYEFDDIKELNLERIYTLTIKALPFANSQDPVDVITTAPVATTPTIASVDTCSSITGWSTLASPGYLGSPSLSTSGGMVHGSVGWPASSAGRSLNLIRSSLSASLTSTPYIRVKMTVAVSGGGAPSSIVVLASFNGGALMSPVARDGDYYWYAPGVSTVTSINLYNKMISASSAGSIGVHVDDISRTDTTSLLTVAGQRQQFVALPIQGSARARGNLTVKSASSALGSVLLYTNKDISGFQPDLRRRLVVGPTETTDTSLVSQKSSPLSTTHTFLVPNVPPSGYVLMARLKHSSTGSYNVTWTADAATSAGTTFTGSVGVSGTTNVSLTAATWTILPIAKLPLPTAALVGGGQTKITLSGPANLLLDEAWLFDADNGDLTHAELGTGTAAEGGPYNELRLLAATLDNPAPSEVVLGDGVTMVGAGGMLRANDPHEFVPPLMNVFVVTTGSVTSFMELYYQSAWHTHVVA